MSLKLPKPPGGYDREDQAQTRGALERADAQNLKRGTAVTYLLLSRADGTVGKLTVNGSGVLTWTPI